MITEAVGGAALLLKGLRFLAQRPRLFWLGAVPPFIMSVVFAVLLVLLITRLSAIADAITPFADGWAEAARTAMQVLAGAGVLGVTLLVMIISFSTLTMAFGAPIYDKISEAVDDELSGGLPDHDEPWSSSLPRALRQSVGLIAISVAAALPLFLAQFIPVVGQTVDPRRRGVLRRLDALLRADRAQLRAPWHPDDWPSVEPPCSVAAGGCSASRCPASCCSPSRSSPWWSSRWPRRAGSS